MMQRYGAHKSCLNNPANFQEKNISEADPFLPVQGSLSDADHAVRLSPSYAKAFVRRARALQSLGDFPGAEAAAKDALALEPKNGELKRLVREIQAGEAEAAHEAALKAAAGDDDEAAQMAGAALGLSEVRNATRSRDNNG